MVMLSSCSLTQQAAPVTPEDAAAQKQAAEELEQALKAEEKQKQAETAKATRESGTDAETADSKKLENLIRQASEELQKAEKEEQIQAAAEAAARESERVPQLMNSRRRTPEAPEPPQEATPSPTAEQQAAAQQILQQEHAPGPPAQLPQPEKAENTPEPPAQLPQPEKAENTPEPSVYQTPGDLRSGLRMRRFAPPEEKISKDNDDEPLPNSVELRGFRSPTMKGTLPMNIDGKIIKED